MYTISEATTAPRASERGEGRRRGRVGTEKFTAGALASLGPVPLELRALVTLARASKKA